MRILRPRMHRMRRSGILPMAESPPPRFNGLAVAFFAGFFFAGFALVAFAVFDFFRAIMVS